MRNSVLAIGIIFLVILVGCAQEVEIPPSVPEEIVEEATTIPEKSKPIEGEANNLTDIIPQQQDVTVNQPAMQETKVQEPKCSREFSPQFNAGPYYEGALFDAHFHMPQLIDFSEIEGPDADHDTNSIIDPVLGKDVSLDKILCNFDKEKVRGSIGFSIGIEPLLEETLKAAESVKTDSLGKIYLFLMPQVFSTESLESIESTNNGLFAGYGEIAFYFVAQKGQNPDDQKYLDIYEVAGKHNLIVMMHPDAKQENSVGNAATKNPNVKFLIHGPEMEGSITNLMDKHPNVYYSIDAILIRIPPIPGGLLYTSSNKEEFILTFTENFDILLNRAVKDWKEKIEQHPDRFMWGTDRAHKWHYDEEVSALLEEFGRAFIARLDPAVQKKFAYENAENLFKN